VQAGVWDVDGNEIQKIKDPSLARAILDKVKAANFDTTICCTPTIRERTLGFLYLGIWSAVCAEWKTPQTVD
jgi:hypothetical protein